MFDTQILCPAIAGLTGVVAPAMCMLKWVRTLSTQYIYSTHILDRTNWSRQVQLVLQTITKRKKSNEMENRLLSINSTTT